MTARFQGALLSEDRLAVSRSELMAASLKADPELRQALAEGSSNVAQFAKKSMRKNWSMRNSHGARVGEKFDPFTRVGIYVPGGTAPLVSTAIMTIPLAKVAGCKEIVVCTPCDKTGSINPALLYAAQSAGATEIYRVGALSLSPRWPWARRPFPRFRRFSARATLTLWRLNDCFFGYVAMDLLPGPSELLVLADDTANAAYVAADLLAQAEHGSGYERVWLLTPSLKFLKSVEKEIGLQLPDCGRRELIERVLDRNTWLIQTKDMAHAIELANVLAPEHCEVAARNADQISEKLLTAGAIFIGNYSPTVLGDYVAGPSHTLPDRGRGNLISLGCPLTNFNGGPALVEYDRNALEAAMLR